MLLDLLKTDLVSNRIKHLLLPLVTTLLTTFILFSLTLALPITAYGRTIFIEPGHGGIDPGAVGYNGLLEKTVNLAIAQKLDVLLRQGGYLTVLSRSDDATYSDEDADIIWANNIHADAFVSIHNDSNEDSSVGGNETWYFPKSGADLRLAQSIHDHMAQALQLYGIPDWGLMVPDPGWMIARGSVPAVLIEGAFVSNPDEAILLQSDGFQWVLAQAVFAGIDGYFGADDITYESVPIPNDMTVGATSTYPITLKNTGTSAWFAADAHPVSLSYHWVNAQTGAMVLWDGLRTGLPADVTPGQSVTLSLPVQAPATRGAYTLQLDMVREGINWFSWGGLRPREITVYVHDDSAEQTALTAFVTALYNSLLLRNPESVGLYAWSTAIEFGVPRAEAAFRIMTTHEYHRRMVDEMYRDILARGLNDDGDPGREAWAGAMDRGLSLRQMRSMVYGSEEFAGRYPTTAGYVDFLYRNVLRRDPDQTGKQAWIRGLDSGEMTRATVAYAFMCSDEYYGNYIDGKYREILGRGTEPAGLAAWLGGMRGGLTEEVLPAQLYGSTEYYGYHSGS